MRCCLTSKRKTTLILNSCSIPLCGLISQYNGADDSGPHATELWRAILVHRIQVKGFIVSDHFDQMNAFLGEVMPAVASGKIKTRETVTNDIENAPEAFISLFSGGNFGKAVVKVSDD